MKKIVYFLVLLSFLSCQKRNKQKVKPQVSSVTESVYASVIIKPDVSYFPQSSRTGIIQEISIEKGDTIKQGQVIFKIITSNADNRLIDAKLNLEQAKANYLGENNLLTNIKLDIQIEKQQLLLDSINFKRYERLWNQKVGAKIDLDQAKIKYETTLNRYNTLKKKYEQTYESLENNYKKAQNLVENERISLNDYVVNAEIDGKVYDIFKEVGELISPQEKFAEIGSIDNFKIEMDIDEVDITKINIGDTAIIALEAYPNEVFKAKITKIYPKKDENTQTFNIESVFIQEPNKLYNGLSGEANIVVAKRNNVITIPTEYLKPNNIVTTTEGEKTVITGIKNLDFVEIISGIDTTTTLINPSK